MNPEIKAEWLDDLRSGDIGQTQEVLSDGEGRCCLGVLCDIAVRHGVAKVRHNSDGIEYYTSDNDADYTSLPAGVAIWAGLVKNGTANTNPEVSFSEAEKEDLGIVNRWSALDKAYLATLNDKGKTFAEIADLIENSL